MAAVRALVRALVSALVSESNMLPPITGATVNFSQASNSMYVAVISGI